MSLTENAGEHRSKGIDHNMVSKIDGPSGPRPRFFIVGLSHFQRGFGHYTWPACKTAISEEVRSHQSNVISRLFVIPGPPTD